MIPNGYDPKTDEELLKFLAEQVGFENYGNAIERGLDRIRPLFKQYLNQWKGKVITVAGTNGKGETVLYLRDIFRHYKKTFSLLTIR